MRVVSRMVLSGAMLAAVVTVVGAQGAAPVTAAPAPAGALKIAYLNSNQVLEGAPGRTEALAQFEKETLPMRTQMQRMSDSLQAMIGNYQKAAPQLTPAIRAEKEATIQGRQQEYQQRAQEMQQAAQTRQEVLMAPIMEQVNKVIQDVRAEDGYAFIFDSGAQVPFIVSADKNLDITARIIDRLKSLGAPKLPAMMVVEPGAAGAAGVPGAAKPPVKGPVATPTGVTRPRP